MGETIGLMVNGLRDSWLNGLRDLQKHRGSAIGGDPNKYIYTYKYIYIYIYIYTYICFFSFWVQVGFRV